MALTIEMDHPAYPDGYEIGITGLGVFKNREAREVTEEEELAFASFYGELAQDRLKDAEMFTVSGTAVVTSMPDVEISDRPSLDPTAMNLVNGEVFEFANLGGAVTEPDEVAEAPAIVDNGNTTVTLPGEQVETTIDNAGGGET